MSLGKDLAKGEIDQATQAKKEVIENTAGLTAEEKQTAKEKVEEADKAKDAIEKATTTEQVKDIVDKTLFVVLPTEKLSVKDINNLTPSEKQQLEELLNKYNLGITTTFDNQGNVTIAKEGKTVTIPLTELVKQGSYQEDKDTPTTDKPTLNLEEDTDKDGFNNEEELKAGTNPFDKNSHPENNTKKPKDKQLSKTGVESGGKDYIYGASLLGIAGLNLLGKRKRNEEK